MIFLVSSVLQNKEYRFSYLLRKTLSKDLKEVRERAMYNCGGSSKYKDPEAGMYSGKNPEANVAGAEGGGLCRRG